MNKYLITYIEAFAQQRNEFQSFVIIAKDFKDATNEFTQLKPGAELYGIQLLETEEQIKEYAYISTNIAMSRRPDLEQEKPSKITINKDGVHVDVFCKSKTPATVKHINLSIKKDEN